MEFDKSTYHSKWSAFKKFLDISREQALQNKVLFSTYRESDVDDKQVLQCRKCGEEGHVAKRCVVKGVLSAATIMKVDDYFKERGREEKGKVSMWEMSFMLAISYLLQI